MNTFLLLKSNLVIGKLPDLSFLHEMKMMFMGENSFTGSLPADLVQLTTLETLYLSKNNFTGI